MQQQGCPEINFREIFCVARLSSFSTPSAQSCRSRARPLLGRRSRNERIWNGLPYPSCFTDTPLLSKEIFYGRSELFQNPARAKIYGPGSGKSYIATEAERSRWLAAEFPDLPTAKMIREMEAEIRQQLRDLEKP
jgi:hypothetical protein